MWSQLVVTWRGSLRSVLVRVGEVSEEDLWIRLLEVPAGTRRAAPARGVEDP
jgi:hypothetical protein